MSRTQRKYFGITATEGFIKCYEEIILRLKEKEFSDFIVSPNAPIINDLKIYRRFMEHKQVLKDRFEYLAERYSIRNEEVFKLLQENSVIATLIFNLAIKTRVTNSRAGGMSLLENFKKIYKNEEILLPKLLDYTEVLVDIQKNEVYVY